MSIYYKYAPDREKMFCYLMLVIFSIGIHMNLLENVFGHYRKYITCEFLGICKLVYVNQYFSDERPLHFSGSGYI